MHACMHYIHAYIHDIHLHTFTLDYIYTVDHTYIGIWRHIIDDIYTIHTIHTVAYSTVTYIRLQYQDIPVHTCAYIPYIQYIHLHTFNTYIHTVFIHTYDWHFILYIHTLAIT